MLAALIRKRDRGRPANENLAKVANDEIVVTQTPLAELATLSLANASEAKTAIAAANAVDGISVDSLPPDSAKEAFDERAAIMEYDGQLDRTSAEKCAHAIVFCHDCQHHMLQPDSPSRSGNTQATPSGCELGLIAPDSWPPIYSFTGWFCGDWVASEPASGSRLRQE